MNFSGCSEKSGRSSEKNGKPSEKSGYMPNSMALVVDDPMAHAGAGLFAFEVDAHTAYAEAVLPIALAIDASATRRGLVHTLCW